MKNKKYETIYEQINDNTFAITVTKEVLVERKNYKIIYEKSFGGSFHKVYPDYDENTGGIKEGTLVMFYFSGFSGKEKNIILCENKYKNGKAESITEYERNGTVKLSRFTNEESEPKKEIFLGGQGILSQYFSYTPIAGKIGVALRK